jgi:phage gp45-like
VNLATVLNAVRLGVARARVERFRADTTPRAIQATAFAGEVLEDVHFVQHFGFASRPAPGSEAIVVMVGGDRSHPVAVASVDRRHAGPELAEGDVVLFSSSGDQIHLPASGGILIRGDVDVEGSLRVEGGVTAGGDVEAAGEVADNAGTLGALRDAYDVHTHAETQSVTGPPVPLSNGGGELALESTGGDPPPFGGGGGSGNVVWEQGISFYDVAGNYQYTVFGVDGRWQATRHRPETDPTSTDAAQEGPRPTDIATLSALEYA